MENQENNENNEKEEMTKPETVNDVGTNIKQETSNLEKKTNDTTNINDDLKKIDEEIGIKSTEEDYFALKQPLITSEMHCENEKHLIPTNDEIYDEEQQICLPKVNGNHKDLNDETNDSLENETVENPPERKIDEECNASLFNSLKVVETTGPLANINHESRCSSPSSACSSSTAHSSSSQHLVIDQQTDEEKLSPIRSTIKKKKKSHPKKKLRIPKSKKELTSNIAQNVIEYENNNIHESIEKEAEVQCSHTSPSLLPDHKDMSDILKKSESQTLVSDCNKLNLDLTNELSSHPRTCSYKTNDTCYYKCVSCGTHHENWSFFLHIREQHDRFLCLYCIKCFPTAEKLSLHLEIKHDLEQNHFNSEESFRSSATVFNGYALETRFLMCCTCQHVFGERVPFTEHVCMEYMKACFLCGQKGRHTNQCKAHPFAKRRSKKKVKEKQMQELQTLPSTDNSPIKAQEEPPAQRQEITSKPTTQNEDSNSSSNMVIDESCSINHSLSGKINTFQAPDESDPELKVQPFDTRQESLSQLSPQLSVAESENTNFLKFKLRVPKQFQKPVDAIISSSESDDGVCEEEITDNGNRGKSLPSSQENNIFEKSKTDLDDIDNNESLSSEHEAKLSKTVCENESADEDYANPQLARILQEIEQTKLDIKRTKETLHHSHSNSEKADDTQKMIEQTSTHSVEITKKTRQPSLQPVDKSPKRNWTPTPPASPKTSNISTQSEGMSKENSMNIDPNENTEEKDLKTIDTLKDSITEAQNIQSCNETNSGENLEKIDTNADNESNDLNTCETNSNDKKDVDILATNENNSAIEQKPNVDDIEIANEDSILIELQLDKPLEKYEIVDFVRICLKAAYPFCLYCNHARRIAVNGKSLVLHLIAQHRFSATVDSITAEELKPETIVAKLRSYLPQLENEFFNTSSYCTIGAGVFTRHFNERIFECFQCRFVTTIHKELYLHNRKMHLRTAILCFMCRCNFFSFSEILCHICPGVPHKVSIFEIKFRCCLCDLDNIPSPFRLMVHLRKRHCACDICLEDCRDQAKLSSHVWKHKLHHLCYRCGIAYRNKMDITKHLFWKHGTESTICKRCLNKRWPHVYHFCVPPSSFICEVCQHSFTKAMYLTVHKRIHLGDFRYSCAEENCEEKFISRKLLLKHAKFHQTVENDVLQEKNEECNLSSDNVCSLEQESKNETDNVAPCDVDIKPTGDEKVQESLTMKNDQELNPEDCNKLNDETKPCVENSEFESEKLPQKKKKKKRAKESLEDLNLTAPNLSESGSSSDSESETKSKYEEEVSKSVLSPPSESGDVKEQKMSEMEEVQNTGIVLDIWKNFLQAQQANGGGELESTELDYLKEENTPVPKALHVCYSDHDYCKMFYNDSSQQSQNCKNDIRSQTKTNNNRKRTQSIQRPGSRNSKASTSSSDESSDTSSSSSCSCGSNCSCTGGSSSSSSSSSSENSSSSIASRKRQRKKSERNNRHRKSESISPRKNHNALEIINVIDADEETPMQGVSESQNPAEIEKSEESFVNESDLETAESDTDEEYYDEHPQKLASELLSQKRAQLMARTFLSPSHNFDIVENSRPSTPSLPEDIVYEKRKKKKKRERKSTSKSNILPPKFETNEIPPHASSLDVSLTTTSDIQQRKIEVVDSLLETTPSPHQLSVSVMELPVTQQVNAPRFATPRISEGSSCSDVDGSLKRSKRARRPNKFYGYTSDDESMVSHIFGPSCLIGMRAFKPQPPPQLVWNKEDLPTPSKSIFNNKKTTKAQKRHEMDPNGISTLDNDEELSSLPKKKKISSSLLQSLKRKKNKKLPPIPRLKLRPALFGMNDSTNSLQNSFGPNNDFDIGSHEAIANDADDSSDVSSEDGQNQSWINSSQPTPTQPQQNDSLETSHLATKPSLPLVPAPLPPTPQTTVFNHKIPPALLPNPDFATLQYFKANNIRYPIRPPAGARAAREGESVYCYCRCPYDEVSEMIACDGDNCLIEWFHFECVGIMVAPQGKWFCAECRPHYSEDLYPQSTAPSLIGTLREH